jgi:hypothetical protein
MVLSRSRRLSGSRVVAIAAATAITALGVPAAASASDATFATSSLAGLRALATKEAELNLALTKVKEGDDATLQAAREGTAGVRQYDVLLSLSIAKEKTSTAAGATAKQELLAALKAEYQGYGLVDQGLRAYQDGDQAKGKELIKRGSVKLKAAQAEAVAAGKVLRKVVAATKGD